MFLFFNITVTTKSSPNNLRLTMKYRNNLLYKYAAIQPNGQSVTKYRKKKEELRSVFNSDTQIKLSAGNEKKCLVGETKCSHGMI